ncbi:pectate lyase superfamily protein-domain-containing protein [Aspergillus desertorum]
MGRRTCDLDANFHVKPSQASPRTPKLWYEEIEHNGQKQQVFRNAITDYGANHAGQSDASSAIKKAIGGMNARSSRDAHAMGPTAQPAIVYLPGGTYLLKAALQLYVGTVLVGNPTSPPVLKAARGFAGDHIIYGKHPKFGGTTNFYIGMKNLVLDPKGPNSNLPMSLPDWTVSQHVSLTTQYDYDSNIIIGMQENDFWFNGGSIGMKLSGQQCVFRNFVFTGTTTGVGVTLGCQFSNGKTGIDATNTSGSLTVIDSSLISSDSNGAGNPIVLKNIQNTRTTVSLECGGKRKHAASQRTGVAIQRFPALLSGTKRIVGDHYASVISGASAQFRDPASVRPMVKSGYPRDVDVAHVSDIMFTAGEIFFGVAINIVSSKPGDVGFSNAHIRIGRVVGNKVESRCTAGPDKCKAARAALHLTSTSSAYNKNINYQTIFTGRGVLVEAAYHHTLYWYIFKHVRNVFSTTQQSEPAYWQEPGYHDCKRPNFAQCAAGDALCRIGLFERIHASSLFLYGGCNWVFSNNNGNCNTTNGKCQKNAVQITDSSAVYLYGTNTKSTTNMVLSGNQAIATKDENAGGWGAVIAVYCNSA